jgi:predicted DNA-binding protein
MGRLISRLAAMSTTIRVSERTRDRFAKLAETTGRPMSQLVDEAADALERRVFFEELSARYDDLRADPAAWREIEAERRAESGALSDHSS